MASGNAVSGKDLLWAVKRSEDTQFVAVICQVDLTHNFDRDKSVTRTKCGPDIPNSPLESTGTISGKVRTDIQPNGDAISVTELQALIIEDSNFVSKFSNKDGTIYIEGDTELSHVEISGNSTDNADFSCDVTFTSPDDILLSPTT